MVKKSNIKNEDIEENKDIFKICAGSYKAVSKMWEDSYEKVYRPWLESSGEMFGKTVLISKEAAPQKYREFYDEWIKTYQNTFGKLYPIPTPQSNKEIIEKFLSRTDESNKLIKSWIDELEENFRKTKDILGDEPDPAKYKECNDIWMKSYEKIFENFLKLPSEKNTKELFGEYAGITDFYQDGFLQLSKLWKRSYTQICEPMNESMLKLSEKMSEISKGDASPESYKEFYSLWVDAQKEIFEKYGKSDELSREMFETIIGTTDIYLGMYKSWIAALEEMSGKAQELSKQSTGTETYNKFYDLWMKTYEKAFEGFTDTFSRMSNMWVKPGGSLGVSSASAYPGKNKHRGIHPS